MVSSLPAAGSVAAPPGRGWAGECAPFVMTLDQHRQELIATANLLALAQANGEASRGSYSPGSQPSLDGTLFVADYAY